MGKAAVWFIVCIMAFLALFPWLYRYYEKRPFLWLLAASVLFAAFRSGTVMDYGRLYYQVSFRLWQFCWGCGVRPGIWNGGRVHGDGFGLEQARRGCWLLLPPPMKESEPELFIPGVRCFFRHLCPVHCLPCGASACRPCLPPPEMGGDWRGNGLRPFSVPHAGDAGHGRSTPHAAGTCGNEVGVDGLQFYSGESPCVFPWLSPISSISMWRSARWGRG